MCVKINVCVCEGNTLLTSFAGATPPENAAVATSISMEASAVTSSTGYDEVAASIAAAAAAAAVSINIAATSEDSEAVCCAKRERES